MLRIREVRRPELASRRGASASTSRRRRRRSATTVPPWASATWRRSRARAPSRAGRAPPARGRSGRTRTAGRPRRSRGRGRARVTSPSRTRHLDGAAGRAPLRRVVEQVADRALERRGHAADERLAAGRSSKTTLGPVAPRALDRACGDEVEPDVLGLGRVLLARARARPARRSAPSSRRAARRTSASSCSRSPGGSAPSLREHLDVRAQARQRRAQLVRRVGDELPLRARRLLERARACVLKLAASRLSSSRPCTRSARERSPVSVTRSVAPRQPSHRRERRAARPRSRARRRPRRRRPGDQEQDQLDAVERAVDLVSGRATCTATVRSTA